MPSKYSEADIARLAGQDYKSLSSYEKRLVRGHNRGLSRSESRGHARVQKGETPISQRSQAPKVERGTGKPVKQPKPVLPVSERRKISRPYVQNIYRKSDTEKKHSVGKAVNARNEATLGKQIQKVPDSSGVLFHIVNTKTGEEIRAVGTGRGSTVSAAVLKQAIAREQAHGKSYNEALRSALRDLFTLYGVDPLTGIRTSEELDELPDDVSNFIMYTIY